MIFAAGAATGGLLVRTYAPRIVRRLHVSPPLPMSIERRMEYISKLDRELELSPEQRKQAEQIIAASQERMKQLWEPFEPRVKEEYRRSRREISEILSPEQREKMKRWHRERFRDGSSKTNSALLVNPEGANPNR
ncbi:MAG TPA: hypothetical protein VK633_03890 [Verrucomicrobiae bacterium]|nr:hypothetical protein [Verrucomicrobiae bacterium]